MANSLDYNSTDDSGGGGHNRRRQQGRCEGTEAAADLGYRAMDCTDTFLKFQTSL